MNIEKAKETAEDIPNWNQIDSRGTWGYEEVAKALAVMYTYATMLERELNEVKGSANP